VSGEDSTSGAMGRAGGWNDEWEDPSQPLPDLTWVTEVVRVAPPDVLYVISTGVERLPRNIAAPLDPTEFRYLSPTETIRRVNNRTITVEKHHLLCVSYAQKHVEAVTDLDWNNSMFRVRAIMVLKIVEEGRPQPCGLIRWDHRGKVLKQIERIDDGGENTEREVLDQLKALRILERGYPRLGAPPDPDAEEVRGSLVSGGEEAARRVIKQQRWYRNNEKQIKTTLDDAAALLKAKRITEYCEQIKNAEEQERKLKRAVVERLRRAHKSTADGAKNSLSR